MKFSCNFRVIDDDDYVQIMKPVLMLLTARDMSLNRRAFVWLLSADENSENRKQYFEKNSLTFSVQAFKVFKVI